VTDHLISLINAHAAAHAERERFRAWAHAEIAKAKADRAAQPDTLDGQIKAHAATERILTLYDALNAHAAPTPTLTDDEVKAEVARG
jgi:hypothetical protein